LVIHGEYGSGKTHLLDYIYFWALENGYAVARCEIDAFDVAPYRPKRIYRELVRGLRFIKDSEDMGFTSILSNLKNTQLPKRHIFFSRLFELLKDSCADHYMLFDWIRAEEMPREFLDYCKMWRLPVLLPHSPAADLYCYLLSGLGFLLNRLGAKGLVLILDEAETLFHLYFRDQELGVNFYKGLLGIAMNDPQLLQPCFSQKTLTHLGVGRLDDIGFIHSAVRPVPYLYEIPSNIFLIIAFTPASEYYYKHFGQALDLTSYRKIHLSRLTSDDIKNMFDTIVDLYQRAFCHFVLPSAEKKRMLEEILMPDNRSIRQIIKLSVEMIDLYRHYTAKGSFEN
jgi:hypothetical protein